jgi:hypothetical protein
MEPHGRTPHVSLDRTPQFIGLNRAHIHQGSYIHPGIGKSVVLPRAARLNDFMPHVTDSSYHSSGQIACWPASALYVCRSSDVCPEMERLAMRILKILVEPAIHERSTYLIGMAISNLASNSSTRVRVDSIQKCVGIGFLDTQKDTRKSWHHFLEIAIKLCSLVNNVHHSTQIILASTLLNLLFCVSFKLVAARSPSFGTIITRNFVPARIIE